MVKHKLEYFDLVIVVLLLIWTAIIAGRFTSHELILPSAPMVLPVSIALFTASLLYFPVSRVRKVGRTGRLFLIIIILFGMSVAAVSAAGKRTSSKGPMKAMAITSSGSVGLKVGSNVIKDLKSVKVLFAASPGQQYYVGFSNSGRCELGATPKVVIEPGYAVVGELKVTSSEVRFSACVKVRESKMMYSMIGKAIKDDSLYRAYISAYEDVSEALLVKASRMLMDSFWLQLLLSVLLVILTIDNKNFTEVVLKTAPYLLMISATAFVISVMASWILIA